jgi:uncharacterized protein Ymh
MAVLDQNLLKKLEKKTGLSKKSLRETISHRASKQSISPQTSQILLAKQHGIATGRVYSELPPHLQQEVREATSNGGNAASRPTARGKSNGKPAPARGRKADPVRDAVDHLLSDTQIRKRCGDILKGRGPYDRVVREATTILDARLKKVGGLTGYWKPVDVIGKVVNPDPDKTILRLSGEKAEQEGFHSIFKGLTLAFRGPIHHEVSDELSREGALKVCGFVDVLLGIIAKGKTRTETTP